MKRQILAEIVTRPPTWSGVGGEVRPKSASPDGDVPSGWSYAAILESRCEGCDKTAMKLVCAEPRLLGHVEYQRTAREDVAQEDALRGRYFRDN